jgi:dipeptidyl-peptidase-4
VSPTGQYFIDTVSTIASPPVMSLRRGDGSLVRTLGEQKTAAQDEYAWGKAEIFTVPSGDGYDLPVSWVLPPDFDPAKRYPVLLSVYGGPDAGTVHNRFPGLSPHYFAERGVIMVSADHRASGHFGKKGVALMHRSLGRWEMHDYIAVTKWLRSKPFVAKDRVGITGGSYGGYMAMMAMFYGAGGEDCAEAPCFNYAQAGSAVTDWMLYDTVYTERYMDTPKENPDGYKAGAVLTYADRYKGGLRITHGTIDDNVHVQNSLQVIDWLTSNNKPFEMMLYPDSRHGIVQRAHASRESHDFWVRTLLGGRLPMPPQTAPGKGTR